MGKLAATGGATDYLPARRVVEGAGRWEYRSWVLTDINVRRYKLASS